MYVIIIAFIILYVILRILENRKKYEKYSFKGKFNNKVLTENEYSFFVLLKEIVDRYDYLIFSKIRLADLIKTNDYNNFNKVRSKHIDFVITNEKTEPLIYIELDDNSHLKEKNKERDLKKDIIFNNCKKYYMRVKINEMTDKLKIIDDLIKVDILKR